MRKLRVLYSRRPWMIRPRTTFATELGRAVIAPRFYMLRRLQRGPCAHGLLTPSGSACTSNVTLGLSSSILTSNESATLPYAAPELA